MDFNNFGDNFNNDFDDDWIEDRPPRQRSRFGRRNQRYNNAYGDYRGGYGPGGGFGPPGFSGPPGPPGPIGQDFAPGPPPPIFMWDRGFGPNGPPVRKAQPGDRAYKYLMRCGIPKDQLKSLPRDMLDLIEPQYCGLCDINLESFSMSRLHYLSKNHQKNQKKWMVQHSDWGFSGSSKEPPLKARELYCELCDVHITSKTHADSHYAGKPHRAIVEGRKKPRNPSLLQRSMSDRLGQLIRREKRSLKAMKDNDEPETVKETKEVVKPVQPDLYCDICKTAVTCTEQMTMHMNGKKHLAKEKQHILKMMKGGGNNRAKKAVKDEAEYDENEEEEGCQEEGQESQEDQECQEGQEGQEYLEGQEGQEDQEGQEGQKDQEDQEGQEGQGQEEDQDKKIDDDDCYDWGNGSEQWEETVTTT